MCSGKHTFILMEVRAIIPVNPHNFHRPLTNNKLIVVNFCYYFLPFHIFFIFLRAVCSVHIISCLLAFSSLILNTLCCSIKRSIYVGHISTKNTVSPDFRLTFKILYIRRSVTALNTNVKCLFHTFSTKILEIIT